MSTSSGFELHPLHDLFFFELSFTPAALDDKKIHLQYHFGGCRYDGVFTMRAWAHPRLSGFMALKAQGDGLSNRLPMVYTVTFDSARAQKIREVTHERYQFEADLGDLQALKQVPHIWDSVREDFDREVVRIGPIREIRSLVPRQ